MPESFGFPMYKGLWLPIPTAELEAAAYSGNTPNAYARLRPGTSHAAAETELTAFFAAGAALLALTAALLSLLWFHRTS